MYLEAEMFERSKVVSVSLKTQVTTSDNLVHDLCRGSTLGSPSHRPNFLA